MVEQLDLSLALQPGTRPQLLQQLRRTLIESGIFYIAKTGISDKVLSEAKTQCKAFFDLPAELKKEINVAHAASFMGYSGMGDEFAAGKLDCREQLEFTNSSPPGGQQQPLYRNLLGPSQWPRESALPGFRPAMEDFFQGIAKINDTLSALVAESLGMPSNAFAQYFDQFNQYRLKCMKYPEGEPGQLGQGCGAHKDNNVMSYVYQASPHHVLQVQDPKGIWTDCPPKDGTFVVIVGQALQLLTQGVCNAPTHRVISPEPGLGPRYSFGSAKAMSFDADMTAVLPMPTAVMAERDEVRARSEKERIKPDEVVISYNPGGQRKHLGEQALLNRIKVHPEVGKRYYPELHRQIFEDKIAMEDIVMDNGRSEIHVT